MYLEDYYRVRKSTDSGVLNTLQMTLTTEAKDDYNIIEEDPNEYKINQRKRDLSL